MYNLDTIFHFLKCGVLLFKTLWCVWNLFSILASQLRADWSVTLDRLDNKYYVTWGSSLTASVAPTSDAGKDGEGASVIVSGGSLPPHGKMLGKLDQKDFRQVISKGMKTYGMFWESSKQGQVGKLSLWFLLCVWITAWEYQPITFISPWLVGSHPQIEQLKPPCTI